MQSIDPESRDASGTFALMVATLEFVNIQGYSGHIIAREKLHECKRMSQAQAQQRRTLVSQENGEHVTTLADFVCLRRISSGAYARVFLARKEKTGDICVIKVTPPNSIKQKNALKRILSERDILLQLASEFIVNFCIFHPSDYSILGTRNLYLVMEFLPGGDLYSLLLASDARVYAAQMVAALESLRTHEIIHRDLKPDNILVAAEIDGFRIVVSQGCCGDFGLSLSRNCVVAAPHFHSGLLVARDYNS
jgi:serine/threonine protein kinase